MLSLRSSDRLETRELNGFLSKFSSKREHLSYYQAQWLGEQQLSIARLLSNW